MEHAILNAKKGQALIETLLAVMVSVLLFGGMLKIWVWSNNQVVNRQEAYSSTRLQAGLSQDNYILQWPLDYRRTNLTEEDVLVNSSWRGRR